MQSWKFKFESLLKLIKCNDETIKEFSIKIFLIFSILYHTKYKKRSCNLKYPNLDCNKQKRDTLNETIRLPLRIN